MNEPIVIAGFPVTADISLRKRGEHEGVSYEVANHGRNKLSSNFSGMEDGPGTWCYYVTVGEAMLTPELFAEFWLDGKQQEHRSGIPRVSYDYYAARFAQADWHGGVTYYEKLGGLDGAQRYVKIGCDFAHYWDEGREFDFDQVKAECLATINQLREMYPFRRRCPYYGTYHDPVDMVDHKGQLYSKEGAEAVVKPFEPCTPTT